MSIDEPKLRRTIPTNFEHIIEAVARMVSACFLNDNKEAFGNEKEAARTWINRRLKIQNTHQGQSLGKMSSKSTLKVT